MGRSLTRWKSVYVLGFESEDKNLGIIGLPKRVHKLFLNVLIECAYFYINTTSIIYLYSCYCTSKQDKSDLCEEVHQGRNHI